MGRLLYLHCVKGEACRASQLVLTVPVEVKARLKIQVQPPESARAGSLQKAILDHLRVKRR